MQTPDNTQLLQQQLLSLDRVGAEALVRAALEQGSSLTVVENLIAPALEGIGDGWEKGEVALSQVFMSSRISEELVSDILHPGGRIRVPQPEMAIVVLEDYHLLGKRIIYSVLRAAGYEVIDLGQMDVDGVVAAVAERQIELLFVSTLMLRSALRIKELRARLNGSGARLRIVAGGAPFRFDPGLAEEVGADATAATASELVPVLSQMMEELL